MNKIILLGNMTREPKTTRKKNEDGSEMVITKFDLAVNRRNKQEGNADADDFSSAGDEQVPFKSR